MSGRVLFERCIFLGVWRLGGVAGSSNSAFGSLNAVIFGCFRMAGGECTGWLDKSRHEGALTICG
jgi:hypothetical protein